VNAALILQSRKKGEKGKFSILLKADILFREMPIAAMLLTKKNGKAPVLTKKKPLDTTGNAAYAVSANTSKKKRKEKDFRDRGGRGGVGGIRSEVDLSEGEGGDRYIDCTSRISLKKRRKGGGGNILGDAITWSPGTRRRFGGLLWKRGGSP